MQSDALPRVMLTAGHETQHFNVGQYRRKQNDKSEVQDASFFDHNNPVRPPWSTSRSC